MVVMIMLNENEIAERLAQEMAKEIDEDILSMMLTATGWTRAPVTWAQGQLRDMWTAETGAWCHNNATGNYKFLVRNWHFENAGDATAFVLTWMGAKSLAQ
jgi:hypothetical protein